MPIRILAFENNKIKSWVQVVTTFSKSENPCALLTIWLMSIPAASNVEPKACTEGLSFHAFDVQSKSAWNHQRIALTGVGQISVWSKHSRPMTFERKLKLSPLRFLPSSKQNKCKNTKMDGYVKYSLHLYNCNDNASLRKAVFTISTNNGPI